MIESYKVYVLGIIFFGLFTPIALGMRLAGRDELRLKFKKVASFWKHRDENRIFSTTFKDQF